MSWAWLAIFGGFVGLDGTSFPQAMLSRPIIAATLGGLAFGRPAEGLLIGAILEIFDLGILPIGAARYPEAGTGAVAATGAYLASDAAHAPGLLFAVLFGLVWGRLAGATVIQWRRWTGRLVDAPGTPGPADVERRQLFAMAVDYVRGAVVSTSGAAIGVIVLLAVVPGWGVAHVIATGAIIAAAAGAIGASLTVFGGVDERSRMFLLGLLCGSVLLLVLR
jgi:mannose/fructose/N-acetylgalactosamine-specific phosphotransferase system component IIC